MLWKSGAKFLKTDIIEYLSSNDNSLIMGSDDFMLKEYGFTLEKLKVVEDTEFNNQSLFAFVDDNFFKLNQVKNKNLLKVEENISSNNHDSIISSNSNSNNFILSPNEIPTTLNSTPTDLLCHTNFSCYVYIKPIYILFRRVIHYIIFLNKKLCEELKLSTHIAKEVEILIIEIFRNIKYINILYDRHADQILICCVLAILKAKSIYQENDYKKLISSYQIAKSDDSDKMFKSMFYNIKLATNSNISYDILQFYELFFANKVEDIVIKITNDNEEEKPRMKLRKLSVPDAEIRKIQFNNDSAFGDSSHIYDPFKKSLFGNNKNNLNLIMLDNGSFIHLKGPMSTSVSPMINMTSPGINRTPRTNRVRDIFTDPPPSITQSSADDLRKKLKSQLKNKIGMVADSPNKSNTNTELIFSNSQQSENSLSRKQSGFTPEFNKLRK